MILLIWLLPEMANNTARSAFIRENIIRPRAFLLLFATIFFTTISAQNIELYLSLIDQGKLDEVRGNLHGLELKYPDNPGVKFLRALVTEDGDRSVELYTALIEKYSDSRYADDAAMKIAEYVYARGLYSQASRQFRAIPIRYPGTNHLERSIDLMVKSYQATGEIDTARSALKHFHRLFPALDVAKYGLGDLGPEEKIELVPIAKAEAQKKIAAAKPQPEQKSKPVPPVSRVTGDRPWVVQVGAFGQYANARNLREKLSDAGYTVVIDEVPTGSRRLHVVRVTRYPTREAAQKVGIELNKRFGLDFRVLNMPE